ncbi:MAG: hypothetical protein UT55_C0021G0001, partial [Candidatus Peregrinibacteria bacterium GW2011_GWE2_39_6]
QTGIRIGELANLRLSDVGKDTLHIAPFEKHEERTIPLNKRAIEALQRYMEVGFQVYQFQSQQQRKSRHYLTPFQVQL